LRREALILLSLGIKGRGGRGSVEKRKKREETGRRSLSTVCI
jgi:hypothetical protein